MKTMTDAQAARLATAIASHRGDKRWTQRQLADRAGVSKSTVQNLENRRGRELRPTTIRPIMEALGWTDSDLETILSGGVVATQPAPLAPIDQALEDEVGRPLTDDERQWLRSVVDGAVQLLANAGAPPAGRDSEPTP